MKETKQEVYSETNLGLRMGTKAQAYWENKLREAEEMVTVGEGSLEINRVIVALAKTKIKKEEEEFKKN